MSEEEKAIEWCKAQKSRYIQILLDLYIKAQNDNLILAMELRKAQDRNVELENDNQVLRETLYGGNIDEEI